MALYRWILDPDQKSFNHELVLRIRIYIGSVFSNFVDPDTYSENGSGSTQLKMSKKALMTDTNLPIIHAIHIVLKSNKLFTKIFFLHIFSVKL